MTKSQRFLASQNISAMEESPRAVLAGAGADAVDTQLRFPIRVVTYEQ